MTLNVRYCINTDGTRIAYAMSGEGFPIVVLTPFIHTFASEGEEYIARGGPPAIPATSES